MGRAGQRCLSLSYQGLNAIPRVETRERSGEQMGQKGLRSGQKALKRRAVGRREGGGVG